MGCSRKEEKKELMRELFFSVPCYLFFCVSRDGERTAVLSIIRPSVCVSVCLHVFVSFCLCVSVSLCLRVSCLYACVSVCLSICLPICLFIVVLRVSTYLNPSLSTSLIFLPLSPPLSIPLLALSFRSVSLRTFGAHKLHEPVNFASFVMAEALH